MKMGPLFGENAFFQRFRKGVGGRGLANNGGQITAKFIPQDSVLRLLKRHRKKGAENRPESLAQEAFLAPTPSVRQPLFETSDSLRLKIALKDAWGTFPGPKQVKIGSKQVPGEGFGGVRGRGVGMALWLLWKSEIPPVLLGIP